MVLSDRQVPLTLHDKMVCVQEAELVIAEPFVYVVQVTEAFFA